MDQCPTLTHPICPGAFRCLDLEPYTTFWNVPPAPPKYSKWFPAKCARRRKMQDVSETQYNMFSVTPGNPAAVSRKRSRRLEATSAEGPARVSRYRRNRNPRRRQIPRVNPRPVLSNSFAHIYIKIHIRRLCIQSKLVNYGLFQSKTNVAK